MLHFQPQYASPRLRSSTSNASSGHELSAVVAPELQNLTADDVDILGAVIQRAGPSATTFFTVFKAYSDVLRERGLDPQEVVYYGKLLKLGTMKGRNWGEKWEMVRTQRNYPAAIFPSEETSDSDVETQLLQPVRSDSRASDEQYPPLRGGIPQRPHVRRIGEQRDVPSKLTNAYVPRPSTEKSKEDHKLSVLDLKEDLLTSTVVRPKGKQPLVPTFTSDEDGEMSSPVPPSYKSAIAHPTHPTPLLRQGLGRGIVRGESTVIGKTITSTPRERPKTTIDLDDAWKNIKMEQDEKYADEFRENMLLARCWEIWKQGYLWITTTHEQIQEARDKLVLRLYFQRWQARMAAQNAAQDALVSQFWRRHLKRTFAVWQAKLRQKRQAAWRTDMRQKMKLVKLKSEVRIKRETWTKWQQMLLLSRAHKHYELGLLFRFLPLWKNKLRQIDTLEVIAEEHVQLANVRTLARFWHQWKQHTSLQTQEAMLAQRVNCRIMSEAFDSWRSRMSQTRTADEFNDRQILKRAIRQWKRSESSVKALGQRAESYLARQDGSLLRAIIRIWRARMRGRRLEQFRSTQTVKNALQKWKYRLSKEGAQLDVANNFLNRTNTRLVASAFQRWREVLTTHQNALVYAVKYDEAHLQARTIRQWRLRLRDNFQSVKVARWAHRYFATRNAWQMWINVVEERKRQRKLKEFNDSKVRKAFTVWRNRATKKQYFKQCELIVREGVEKRILQDTLVQWTNRVIEIKSRELDVAHRADTALLRAAWFKWSNCRRKHLEEMSLLENHLLVKREDVLRRAFHKWLTAKRAAEHRRVTHQRKEAHLRQVAIILAWDKWRERFKEERLRPLEYQLILDSQKHVMHRAFSVWLSKTDSLPAVKFHSTHLKEKFFKMWRKSMPNALRAKKARETDRFNTLARYFDTWVQNYKTKTTLKAVARAKILRLPASSSRQPLPPPAVRSRPLYSGSSNVFPRRRPATPTDDESHAEDPEVVVPVRRSFLTRPPASRERGSRPAKSPPCSEYAASIVNRQPSPVRSIASMPDRRARSPAPPVPRKAPSSVADTAVESDRLWSAIRKVGQTRRPPRNF